MAGAGAAPIARFGLLASAIAGRALQVAPGDCDAPAWTDGATVFIDPGAEPGEQIAAVTVQAALLAAGSLDADVVRQLRRRPELGRRFLAVEGHRALASSQMLLPVRMRSLIDPGVAALADSPAASLATAVSAGEIGDPPRCFGVIRPDHLLAARDRAQAAAHARGPLADGRRERVLAEFDDEDLPGDAVDLFSSPVGGASLLGRLLRRLFLGAGRGRGTGPPGADAPTHWMRGRRGGGGAPGSRTAARLTEVVAPERLGVKYPEWDTGLRRYRADWCTVVEVPPRPGEAALLPVAEARALRRPLARLGTELTRCHRQLQGDDIDVDAAVEARVETMAGSPPDEAVYVDSVRRQRDLSVLLLLDVSGSTAEPGPAGTAVHELQRAAALALATALHDLGDRVALYAFRSQGRSAVHLMPVKRFDDAFDTLALRRLGGLTPSGYTRLGAAIRHSSAVMGRAGGTSRRLLVTLSDGFAYDHGYERRYGEADARRALAEARRRGIGCVCLSVGSDGDVTALRQVFGSAAHAAIPGPGHLGGVAGPLFRSALQAAEVRRHVR